MTPEAPAPFSRDEWQAILVCIGSAGASAIELKDRDAATYGTELAIYAGMLVRRALGPELYNELVAELDPTSEDTQPPPAAQ